MSDSDPREVARAAEIAACERNWERLEAAATQLLSTARRMRSEQHRGGDD